MKKKLFVSTLLILFLPAFLFAQRIVDNAGLLGAPEKADLEKLLAEIASNYNFYLVIVTEMTIGNTSPEIYADNFFDNGGYGADGCLFLRVTSTRDYWFSTSGRGSKILNNTAGGKLDSDVGNFLGSNDFIGACSAFLTAWEEFLELDANGRSYNFFHHWNALLVLIGWVIAALIGFGVLHVWKTQMNTAIPQKQADLYVIPGSIAYTVQKESFLYSNVTKTRRQTNSSKLGSHTSSSGRSHGGRGGRR